MQSGPTRAPAAWSADAVQRNDVADWRFASRLKDIKREVSPQRLAAQAGVPQSDACSRSVEVGKQASERNPSVSAFKTREVGRVCAVCLTSLRIRKSMVPDGCNQLRASRFQQT